MFLGMRAHPKLSILRSETRQRNDYKPNMTSPMTFEAKLR
jgi:hypothetical protein